MNYIQKNPFMELYEKLSVLNEAEIAAELIDNSVSGSGNASDIINRLTEQFTQLINACAAVNTATGIRNGITPAGVFLSLPNQIVQGFEYNPTNLVCYYTSKPTWHFLNEDGVAIIVDSKKKAKLMASNFFDLSKSWLFFCTSGTDNSDTLLSQLITKLGVDTSKVRLVTTCAGLKNIAYGGRRIIGVPYGSACGSYIQKAFCKTATPLETLVKAITPDNLNDFIQSYLSSYPNGIVPQGAVDEYILDFAEFFSTHAFHTPSLTKFYEVNYSRYADVIAYILYNFYSQTKITHSKQSLQYLNNAITQEELLLTHEAKPSTLVRNSTASNAKSFSPIDNAYSYLIPSGVVSDPDFIYKDTFGDALVDAKIFDSLASWEKHNNKAAVKKAIYIICYCWEANAGWYLFKQRNNSWVHLATPTLQDVTTTNALVKFVNKLNTDKVVVPMLFLKDKDPTSVVLTTAV